MAKSNYITREGYDALERELRYLWKEERPRVTQAVSEAAALGDRSENAEYIYGKKRLREIDRRVRFLTKRLDALNIVYPSPQQAGKVYFGAWVRLEDEAGEEQVFRLVGPDEFDLRERKLSIDAPMARALLGKQVDDEISVSTPSGEQTYFIVEIAYAPLS
ncbi:MULTISPECIES: transcription elongation factor GreB [Corallincola]|uniref:Transcription elongation factor GreB n=3 Tax=Corallincola TaxID=1775176 RepID=A0A368NNU4_9GAMM|nr:MULTISPECIES: transcription elongation factor GreB [Corallincola]RCU51129.1 transcription elongation factor GreB [Corallincola holothuriorum]TAA46061.1 transcription elongation factor GreB [Corallincola spongiicola]TCI01425.1 transcription elongation factor GreB [Corallincola luteus]